MRWGQACFIFKIKSLINLLSAIPHCFSCRQMKAAEGIAGFIYAADPTRSQVAGNPPRWSLHPVQQDLGGQGYHVRNGAMGEAHVPSTLWLSWHIFGSRIFFGLFSALIRFFLILAHLLHCTLGARSSALI